MESVRYRTLTPEDHELLVTATLGNLNWCEARFDRGDVRQIPEFARYTRARVERGDFGVVAEVDAEPVGVGWALFLPAEEPGYGYVDERTPEFSVWVAEPLRGRGVGRELTSRVLEAARRLDVSVSLSVEQGNSRAAELYARLGFVAVPERAADGVMIWHR